MSLKKKPSLILKSRTELHLERQDQLVGTTAPVPNHVMLDMVTVIKTVTARMALSVETITAGISILKIVNMLTAALVKGVQFTGASAPEPNLVI